MATFEQIVNSSTLDVVVPNTSLGFPSQEVEPTQWLQKLNADDVERRLAFFDEYLDFLLVLRLESPDDTLTDSSQPPIALLSFLTHTQVSYDATYISPLPLSAAPIPRVGTPPRTVSLKAKAKGHVPPSIFPPSTPNPTPATADQDKRYVRAEGTTLASGVWGEEKDAHGQGKGAGKEDRDAFALLWDAGKKVWTAVFRMSVSVAFLRLPVRDPLLCLTISITLREKPVPVTAARTTLARLIAAAGGEPKTPTKADDDRDDDDSDGEKYYNGLSEVNLLEGLSTAPTFANAPTPLTIPTTRLGPKTRRNEFSLRSTPSRNPTTPSETPTTTATRTLRKSFRKTLHTVSGFRVRMRTVFVPYVLLPQDRTDADVLDALEAGHTERTVVLCIELENAGESGIGFAVEDIDVSVGGDGSARVRLIRWGAPSAEKGDGGKIFPLRMGVMEQYNLLYAVELLSAPLPEREELLLGAGAAPMSEAELQRTVTINVHGRPFEVPASAGSGIVHHEDGFADAHAKAQEKLQEGAVIYPTPTFASRWNCILDLSPQRNRDSLTVPLSVEGGGFDLPHHPASANLGEREVLPEPASPFPTATPRTAMSFSAQQIPRSASAGSNPVAGSKRFTAPSGTMGNIKPRTPANYRASTSLLNPSTNRDGSPNLGGAGPSPLSKLAYTPPSVVAQSYARPPGTPTTTFAPPPPLTPQGFGYSAFSSIPPPASLSPHLPTAPSDAQFAQAPPLTPAYPAYARSPGPSPQHAQGPLAGWGSTVGPAVEIPRSRSGGAHTSGFHPSPGMSPGTPALHVGGASREDAGEMDGTKIVVSVGLLPTGADAVGGAAGAQPRIHPHDQFTLDIFVFNQSAWTRRLEVGCRERRRRRQGRGKGTAGPGIVPLENRVRVGPLRPSTCQSVRMEFLALTPGVHPIDTLTLTDVETGYSMNLRSVMDIVVHETAQEQ
ncbi:hypothetical protein BV25DRAFT_1989048 [Artomyces pyxidatus]|uniref:Uncharacterized protein n=1 Tax=Artomyces pyxidatus TaxID=48021 RepID=A0ACB8TCK9_9AGAM|nr:hypothetical protein BV25DRAFT_1989048 [Artomyces pyxidatus]